ncbi:MAG TPA: DUF1707 and FHA domain-containing protein [Streptosporangiaceae bacterium]|jgi:hypothetical protein|nr:DUF1707 and FHA domain-containing protein [Streptosporangiaceae bacterium]
MARLPDPHSEEFRASDAERERVLGKLGDGFAEGRLSHETLMFRVEATLRARRRGELDSQIADLPTPRSAWLRNRQVVPQRRRLKSPRPLLERVAERGRELSRDFGREMGDAARAAAAWLPRLDRPLPVLTLPDDTRLRFTIGRELTCDMFIGDLTVSRWHADLIRGPGGWRLADLGSTNGTRLNGWRITGPVHVHPGDLVSFGMATFVFEGSSVVS